MNTDAERELGSDHPEFIEQVREALDNPANFATGEPRAIESYLYSALHEALDRLEAAEARIAKLESEAAEHTRWVLLNAVDKVELELLRDEFRKERGK